MENVQLIDSIKTIVKNYLDSSDQCTFLYGTVKSAAPLMIQVESNEKLTLDSKFLMVCQHLTDHEVEVEAEFGTQNGGSPAHTHPVAVKKKITVKNALKAGERVILIRQQGGQKYLVVDRY